MRRILTAFLILLAASAGAQSADPAQARLELGKCYSTCYDRYMQFSVAGLQQYNTMTGRLAHTNLTELQLVALLQADFRVLCSMAAEEWNGMYACYTGCFDMEQTLSSNSSSARSVFIRKYREVRDDLKELGLWDESTNRPKERRSSNASLRCGVRLAVVIGRR